MDLNIFRLINEVVEMVNDVRSIKKVSPLSLQQNNKQFEILSFFLIVRRISLLDEVYEKLLTKSQLIGITKEMPKVTFFNFLLHFYLRILSENYHVSKGVQRLFPPTVYYR